jgi:hypothetical protein
LIHEKLELLPKLSKKHFSWICSRYALRATRTDIQWITSSFTRSRWV